MTLALRDDPVAIARYKAEHRQAWPEVVAGLRRVGIRKLKIYLVGRRLFMYFEADGDFSPQRDFPRLFADARYREWDALMRTMQEPVPEARAGEWWAEMEEVFDLDWPHTPPR